jgi:hypothetical protein
MERGNAVTASRTTGTGITPPPPGVPASPTPANRPRLGVNLVEKLTKNWVLPVLVALIMTFRCISGSEFFSVSDFRDILYNASEPGVLAAGMALVIMGGQIDPMLAERVREDTPDTGATTGHQCLAVHIDHSPALSCPETVPAV